MFPLLCHGGSSPILAWGPYQSSFGPFFFVIEVFGKKGGVYIVISLTVDQKIAPSAFYKGHFKELLVIYDYF